MRTSAGRRGGADRRSWSRNTSSASREAQAAGFRGGRSRRPQAAPRPKFSRYWNAWRAPSRNSASCARGCAREAEADMVRLVAGHRPPGAAARDWRSIRTPCTAWCWAPSRSCRRRRSAACGSTRRTPRSSARCLRQAVRRTGRGGDRRPVARAGRRDLRDRAAATWTPRWIRSFRRSSAAWPTACGSNS